MKKETIGILNYVLVVIVLLMVSLTGCQTTSSEIGVMESDSDGWQNLLDPKLSHWEVWMGVPHETVKGLSAGTSTSKKGISGTPLGLNNDPKNVFSVIMEDNEPILAITGEIYGGLTTLESYENYHIQLQTKWGEKKWEPRLDAKRDSGLLYHCVGKHGSFWNVWKTCLESQVQEGDCGDLYCLAGTIADVKVVGKSWDPKGEVASGNAKKSGDFENANGQWNTMDVYVLGDRAVHAVNGRVVMVLENARLKADNSPLVSGQIQIQSEGAEVYYRRIRIRPITEFPEEIMGQIQ